MRNSVKNFKARPTVQSMPRHAQGSLIVSRKRRAARQDLLVGFCIAVAFVLYPIVLAMIEKALYS